jgi:two-component system chemotaxis response regulator CheY
MTARVSVLVVDDDDDLRETIRDVLHDEGYTTAGAANGAEALGYLGTSPRPSLILLDLSMPVMDGIAFLEVRKADPRLAAISVIVFSAAASVADKVRDFDVDGALAKPIKLAQLLRLIERHCGPVQESA